VFLKREKNRKERADEAVRLVKETMYNNNNNNNDENDEEENRIRPFEFQRKILPWGDLDTAVEDMLLSNNQNSQQISSRKTRKEFALSRRKQEIIVIASLVDKVPNLAGLTRTCEIFGAKKLVIPSKKFQDDDLFSTISVTAEKWLNIEYVPELDLKDYLLSCKKDGYTLVGLEQTSNSKSIENYNFQRKTAILLGKEQEGIPPEFIDMLEDCVEIPQFGIVRSLNVHVSGSILLWEYTRQGLVNKND
jgi:tRNA G18 (ribose-2'-O)-methylase SpoU